MLLFLLAPAKAHNHDVTLHAVWNAGRERISKVKSINCHTILYTHTLTAPLAELDLDLSLIGLSNCRAFYGGSKQSRSAF